MLSFAIENESLKVVVNSKGAELTSIIHKQTGLEYMWSGDAAVWGKHSPVLFPIVGTLKQNRYIFEGNSYELPRHGFARDKVFEVLNQTESKISFLLTSNNDTLKVYPFTFKFFLHYRLNKNKLEVVYQVDNTGAMDMYFSVGGHPAFAVPLVKNTAYDDYWLKFEKGENFSRWPITADGLIEIEPISLGVNTQKIPITKQLFSNDALVFKQLNSAAISIVSESTNHGLTVSFPNFPYVGIWAAKGGDFVCIEPWCGIADSINCSQQLAEKEGIERLHSGKSWQRGWGVEVF